MPQRRKIPPSLEGDKPSPPFKEGQTCGYLFRAICLLDEAGKLFERVLVTRLTQHLE